jgi:hypothetical protein
VIQTRRAVATRIDDIANRHAVAHGKAGDLRARFRHFTDHLVTRHHRECTAALNRMQIGMANAAIGDAHGDVVGPQRAALERPRRQRLIFGQGSQAPGLAWRGDDGVRWHGFFLDESGLTRGTSA